MNTIIDLGNGDSLKLEPARRACCLYPGAGGAQVEVTLKVSKARDLVPGITYRVNARMFVERNRDRQRRMLCALGGAYPVTPLIQAGYVYLSGFVTDEQVRAVEQLRAGGDLWVNLALSVSSVEWHVESEPPIQPQRVPAKGELDSGSTRAEGHSLVTLPESTRVVFESPVPKQRNGDLRFDIKAGEWMAQMAAVEAGNFVELLVPMVGGEDDIDAVAVLCHARELLLEGKVDASVSQARMALEQVRKECGTQKLYETATKKTLPHRTLAERWAILAEDLWATMSGSVHNDDVTKEITYTHADAAMLVTVTAGMLKWLATDRETL